MFSSPTVILTFNDLKDCCMSYYIDICFVYLSLNFTIYIYIDISKTIILNFLAGRFWAWKGGGGVIGLKMFQYG